jgi:hypothetical protein
MTKNLGTVDRTVRVIAGIAILLLILIGEISGTPATVLGIIAAAFLLTSALSFCPVYRLFKFSTKKEPPAQ